MILKISVILIAALVFVACAAPMPAPTAAPPTAAAQPTEPPAADASPTPGAIGSFDLANTKWVLVSIMEGGAVQTTVPGTQVTLEFGADGTIAGSGGCNSFGGKYRNQGEMLTISEVFSTERACMEQEKMQVESAYFKALAAAQMFEKNGEELTISYGNGTGTLTFHSQV